MVVANKAAVMITCLGLNPSILRSQAPGRGSDLVLSTPQRGNMGLVRWTCGRHCHGDLPLTLWKLKPERVHLGAIVKLTSPQHGDED